MSELDLNFTVGVFGHYGNKNLGDEAIVAAVIQNLRKRVSRVRLYGLSINPADTRERHGIESFAIRALEGNGQGPSREPRPRGPEPVVTKAVNDPPRTRVDRIKIALKRIPILGNFLRGVASLPRVVVAVYRELGFLRSSMKVVRYVDLVLVSGSNQFLDNYGGSFAFPYTLLKWTVLAKLTGTKVAFVSVGAGPLDRWLSKLFVKSAIRLSDYCSFRDPGSAELIHSLGNVGSTSIYPDLANSLTVPRASGMRQSGEKSRGNVGINPMPVFDHRYWFIGDTAKYRAYTEKLSSFTRDLIERQYTVTLFPTQIRDELVIEDITTLVKDRYGAEYLEHVRATQCRSLPSLLEVLQETDFVIATRFHGVVLSLLMERPVLGICYQKKTFEVMARYGLDEYAAHLETFQPAELGRKFTSLAENKPRIVEAIREANVQNQLALSEQYDRVLGLCLHDESGVTDD